MSVRPIAFNGDGSLQVSHDERDHGGTVPNADLSFGRRLDGSPDARSVTVPCPVAGCGALSSHPIGGGADAETVQRLFLWLIRQRAAALGVPVEQRSQTAVKARVKALIEAQDGPGRFRHDDLPDTQF